MTTRKKIASFLAILVCCSSLATRQGVLAFVSTPSPSVHPKSLITPLKATHKSYQCDIPLVFVHGMKGSHLSLETKSKTGDTNRRKAWLKPNALLNFPPRPDDHPYRDLSLPLTYSSDCGTIQDRGNLVVDGMVDYIFDFNLGRQKVEMAPFYGHITKHMKELEEKKIRPTKSFVYDWRRSLPELSEEFHQFCEEEFPGKPVQVLAHSMGGLISFEPIRNNPQKYAPGAVLVGVPFGTGIQYFQDLHRGYYTELGRNRQFTPPSQFTMSSHWSFFPLSNKEAGDTFVDVTDHAQNLSNFTSDQSAIGNPGTVFQSTVLGSTIAFDFYDVEDWEKNEVGIFDPRYKNMLDIKTLYSYKEHMKVQLKQAKEWRVRALRPGSDYLMPEENLVVCQTNTVPTLNQILRRKREQTDEGDCSQWEYDYISGRSVPGDGRIDFAKSFPPTGFRCKKVALDSLHAKQMCWEENGGSLGAVTKEVSGQLERYLSTGVESAQKAELGLVESM